MVADVLQGTKPGRMETSLGRAISRMRLPEAPPFKDGDVIFRGVNPTERVRDLFFGGGYYGGAVLHGSPRREIARHFGDVSDSRRKLNVMSVFQPHNRQTYGGNFSVEKLLEAPNDPPSVSHNPLAKGTFETAISKRHNKPVGLLVKGPDMVERFVDPRDTRSLKAVGGLLSELGARGGPPQTKYISQGGMSRVSPSAVDKLFDWQPGTPESRKDISGWLDGLRDKLSGSKFTNPPNFDRLKTLMGV